MWVARNKDERLFIFIDKPKRSKINNWWEVDTKNSLLSPDDCLEIDGGTNIKPETIIKQYPDPKGGKYES